MGTDASATTLSKADRKAGFRLGCEGYLTVAEAAARACMSAKTVRRWVEAGLIRSFKTDPTNANTAVRVCRRSLDEFLGSREQGAR